MSQEMIRRTVALTVKAMEETAEDPDYFYFEGYGSTFGNVDLDDDIMVAGCFTDSLKEHRPSLLWMHDMREPVGVYTDVHETPEGLFVRGKLPKADTFVSGRVIPQMKVGSVNRMSIGFQIEDYRNDVDWKDGVRLIKRCKLWEVSLVTIPANPQATVTGMKGATSFAALPLADEDYAWDSAAAVKRAREFTESTEEPSAAYKRAFMWFDSAKASEFTAYKLPFADVIDGELRAVPKAIFAIAAVLNGARGGVDIPDTDKEKVRSHVSRYYDRMDMTPPWDEDSKSFVTVDMVKALKTPRDIERLLRDSGVFSKSAATALVSVLKSVEEPKSAPVDLAGVLESLRGVKSLL